MNQNYAVSSHPRILFLSLANDIGSERVAAEMIKYGIECGVMSPQTFNCMKIAGLSRRFTIPNDFGIRLGTLFVRHRLNTAFKTWVPNLVLPLDDPSSWLLRSLAIDPRISPQLRSLLIHSLGAPNGYCAAIERLEFMNFVESLGLRKPLHREITDCETALRTADELGYPVVVKQEHTTGGVGVSIAHTPEAVSYLLAQSQASSWLKALRSSAKRRLYGLAGFRSWHPATTILQSYIPGIPAFRTVAAWKGQVLAGVTFAAEKIFPEPTGASTVIRKIENAEIDAATEKMTSALGCSGFVSYDFILDEKTGHATIIEMNARSVGTTHLGRLFGSDVCGALAEILTGRSSGPHAAQFQMAALFPKEIMRDVESPYLKSDAVYHDEPHDQPELMRAYLRSSKKNIPKILCNDGSSPIADATA